MREKETQSARRRTREDGIRPVLCGGTPGTMALPSSRFKQGLRASPNARKDADDTEIIMWIEVLASMLSHAPTLMGALLARQPGSRSLDLRAVLALAGTGPRHRAPGRTSRLHDLPPNETRRSCARPPH